ncbi:hypothetical protein B9Z55_020340 [Caenorhabditis nigoni]|uniref:Uncharacterized protein n=1 Tax=Caenorhabditis nigoni TaxID=1611254 RepID=A0A2G5TMB7_9PELO|nr:hypothetical protein B9Z55_020340 [Caenorhabditis nigoni]
MDFASLLGLRTTTMYIIVFGLQGTLSLQYLKSLLVSSHPSLGLNKTQIAMVIAILENRPIDVLVLGGSRDFEEGEDKDTAELIVNHAVEMLMAEGYAGGQD